MSTLKRFFKDTIIYGIASILPRIVTILLVKLKTNVFKSDVFAIDVTYYVYAAFLNVLLTYGMETAFFRFFTKEKEKGKIISTTFISLLLTTLVFLTVTLYYADTLSTFFGFSHSIIFKLLIATIFFDTLVVIPFAYLRVSNRPIRFAIFKIGNVLINAFFVVFFLWVTPKFKIALPNILTNRFGEAPQIIYVFLAGVIASCSTFIVMLPIMFKFKFDFDFNILKKILRYSLPIMVAGIAYITNENLDKLLLPNYIGDSEMGIYAACYKLGVFMTLFITAFRMGAEPFFFNYADKKNAKTTYAKILTYFTIFGTIFMFIIIAYIQLFAKIIIGSKDYLQALHIVPIVLLANLMLGIYHNLAVWYKLTDKTKYGMFISIFGAMITVLLNIIFIPIYGYIASAWATLFAYSCMTFLSYFLGKKHYPVPYQIGKLLQYISLTSLFSYVSFYHFQENYYISTFLLLVFIAIIYIFEKDEIKQIL